MVEYRDALRQICGVPRFKSRTLFVFIYEFWITYVSPSEVAYPYRPTIPQRRWCVCYLF